MVKEYTRWDGKRTHSINLKLNDYEDDMLTLKSRKTGKNKSEYLRELICSSCPSEAPPKKFYDAVNELNKIGVNINQVAARANSSGIVSEDDIVFLRNTAADVYDRLTEIKKSVKGARPYAQNYFELLAIRQKEAKEEGKPIPQEGDDLNKDVVYKYEDEPDDSVVESLYEMTPGDISDEEYLPPDYINDNEEN